MKNEKESKKLTSHFCKTFCTKVFPLFKIGQKKCPKTKIGNTFQQNPLHHHKSRKKEYNYHFHIENAELTEKIIIGC
jgi:hypothetical protein